MILILVRDMTKCCPYRIKTYFNIVTFTLNYSIAEQMVYKFWRFTSVLSNFLGITARN